METAIPQLAWAHAHAPEGAREVAMEYVVANCVAIQVGLSCNKRARPAHSCACVRLLTVISHCSQPPCAALDCSETQVTR